MLVFYSGNIPWSIQAEMVTTAAVVVALTNVRPLCSWSLLAQKMDGKSWTVHLAAFLAWIWRNKRASPQEVWFRRWERCAASVGKEYYVFFPTLPNLAGKQLQGFPCLPQRQKQICHSREDEEGKGWMISLPPYCLLWQACHGLQHDG